jgi:hypothetical protein
LPCVGKKRSCVRVVVNANSVGLHLNSSGEIACTRASTLVGDDIVDVSLQLVDGERLVRNQLVKLLLAFTTLRLFSNLGAVIRIFDQSGRCAFAKHFVDLDESEICRRLEPDRHVLVVQFSATLPVGWYAVTFSLGENPSGHFQNAEAWIAVAEQTCYVPFYVGDNSALPGRGYCSLPVHSYLAPQGSQDAVGGQTESFPEFPWFVDEPRYSVGQIIAALHEFLPDLNLGQRNVAGELVLNPGCGTFELSAVHPKFHTQVGLRSNYGVSSTGRTGILLFGPYIHARPGLYRVIFSGVGEVGMVGQATADVAACGGTVVFGSAALIPNGGIVEGIIHFEITEPGVVDLEFRVFVDESVIVDIFKISVVSVNPGADSALGFALRSIVKHNNLLGHSISYGLDKNDKAVCDSEIAPLLMRGTEISVIYCASLGWLPLLLGLSDVIEADGGAIVLIVPDDFEIANITGIGKFVLNASSFFANSELFSCNSIVTHSFGFEEVASKLLDVFPSARLELYSDAFTNHELKYWQRDSFIGNKKTVSCFYYFDQLPTRRLYSSIPARIVSSSKVFDYFSLLSDRYLCLLPDLSLDIESYSVLYLRYWGCGIYEGLSTSTICKLIVSTVLKFEFESSVLIIKSDPRVKMDVFSAVVSELQGSGINVMSFDSYLGRFGIKPSCAMMPVEFFYSKGLLVNAINHFVLDSSLGYVLGIHPSIVRRCNIVLGVDQAGIDELPVDDGVNWLNYQSRAFAENLLCGSSCHTVKIVSSLDVMPIVVELNGE